MNIAQFKNNNFFDNDLLNFSKYPVTEVANTFIHKPFANRIINLSVMKSESLKQEIKDLLRSCIESGKPYTIKSRYFIYLLSLPELANKIDSESFLDIGEDILAKLYGEIIKDKNMSASASQIIPSICLALYELKDIRTKTDRDIWYFKNFKIDDTRRNKSISETTLNFRTIKNTEHREYIKKWFRYLLGVTEYSISTIINFLPPIIMFSNYYLYKSIFDINENDVTNYILTLTVATNTINRFANSLSNFYKYMAIKQYTTMPCPVKKYHIKKTNYIPADNLISENTILQIMGKLHLLSHSLMCMYLINYSTGMRVSDICQLNINCLHNDSDDTYYIRVHNCQKMQKAIMNQICHALYCLLEIQIKTITQLPYKEQYLFPAPKKRNIPYKAGTYRQQMKKWCLEMEIKNDDGTPYSFTTHAYRHTLSTDLYQKYGVPIQIIQLAVLWHKEIQMTLTYAQRGNEYNKSLYVTYIKNTGEQSSVAEEIIQDADTLHKKALGNGYCNYPSRLGTCPCADLCLNCQFFRTSTMFLTVHRTHLEEVRKNIILYNSNGWNNNLATALETEKKLITIIESLENLE